MTCGEAKQYMATQWGGEPVPETYGLHLNECSECRSEAAQLGVLWEQMGSLPVPEPSAALRARWRSTLQSELPQAKPLKPRSWAWWPQQPAWQLAVAGAGVFAGLLVGIAVGTFWQRASSDHQEIASLRKEVAGTREMVALSLLKEGTASERLKGVDYSGRMSRLEPEVVTALVSAVSSDPNVNVRLAAVDALMRAAGDSRVRQSLVQSIPGQGSPMVQAALIDYMVDAHDLSAAGPLRQLAAKPDLDPIVRQRAMRALKVLSQ